MIHPLVLPQKLLVVSPHPDDAMMCAGLIQRVLKHGGQVRVLGMTCGDYAPGFAGFWAMRMIKKTGFKQDDSAPINYGKFRIQEDLKALQKLGLSSNQIVHLGYPDGFLWEIYNNPEKVVRSLSTQVDHVPYLEAKSPRVAYQKSSVLTDLAHELSTFKPDAIVTTHPNDNHTDHVATFYFVKEALKIANLSCQVYCVADSYAVEVPKKWIPQFRFQIKKHPLPSSSKWFELNLTAQEIHHKLEMIDEYPSQKAWEHPTIYPYQGRESYLYGYVAENELFAEVIEPKEDENFRNQLNRGVLASRALGLILTILKDQIRKPG